MSSVYDDLKKIGNIIPKVVPARPPVEISDTIPRITIQQPIQQTINIEDIALLIKPPLYIIRDNNGIVHDTSSIIVRCGHGHIHKYFINNILRGTINCITCASGTIFSNTVRATFEDILGSPFVLELPDIGSARSIITYFNPILKIKVACIRTPGINNCVAAADKLIINIHYTLSARKIKNSIHEYLSNYAPLTEKQKQGIQRVTSQKKHIYIMSTPPVTRELAKLNNIDSASPDILDDARLCIENC